VIEPTGLKNNVMPRKPKPTNVKRISPRLRVLYGEEVALGPGKADLLAVVAETGSIREAAERMGMSYMRAWKLIKTMNACFKEPLVEAVRGGREHGGTSLTKAGHRALKLYQQLTKDCLKATTARWKELRALLRD
jgi:molybdate transport system regulatory protein